MGQYIPAPEGDFSAGIAAGGRENQILRKASDINYDTEWVDISISGTPGPQGPAGDNGANGAAATIAVGTTTTGAAGSSASVDNGGTSSAAVFNFTIPQGVAGATGAAGATGVVAATAPLTYDSGTQTVSTSLATNRLLGRSTAGTGSAEEIAIGSGLSLTGGSLSATGGGGGSVGIDPVISGMIF